MASEVDGQALPFEKAVTFFRRKLQMPSATWTDFWKGQHEAAFVVAGAARDDLLADLRAAVDEAIAGLMHRPLRSEDAAI